MQKVIFHIIILFCIYSSILSQNISVSLSKEQVVIGEQLELNQIIESDVQLDSFPIHPWDHIIPAFTGEEIDSKTPYELEVLGQPHDSSYQRGAIYVYERTYRIIPWDSAFVVIPPQTVELSDTSLITPPLLLEVDYPEQSSEDELKDIYELFEDVNLESSLTWLDYLIYFGWIIPIALLIWWFIKKKRRGKEPSLPVLNPQEKAFSAIEQLIQSNSAQEDLKEFYYELSIILRQFLAESLEINAIELTTSEIAHFLKQKTIKKDVIKAVLLILQQSDLVKFAKSSPSEETIQENIEITKNIIHHIYNNLQKSTKE